MSEGKMYTGSIDVLKIDKERLFKGKKGTYLNVVIWVNDEPDQYGNHIKIQQSTKKEEDKIFLGDCKLYVKQETKPEPKEPEDLNPPNKEMPF